MRPLFFHSQLLGTARHAWQFAILFALYILVSAAVALPVARWLLGYHLLGPLLIGGLVLLLFYLFAYFIFLRIRNPRAYLGIVLLILIAFWLMGQMTFAVERFHLLEYALLALLFHKASRFHFHGVWSFALPFLLTLLVSWADELWQGTLPGRVYDLKDVWLNTLGGLLGLGVAWIRRRYAP